MDNTCVEGALGEPRLAGTGHCPAGGGGVPRHVTASAVATAAPDPPAIAITTGGLMTWAAAPARMNATPCPAKIPDIARPNACPRRAEGTLVMNAALAAIW